MESEKRTENMFDEALIRDLIEYEVGERSPQKKVNLIKNSPTCEEDKKTRVK